MDALARLHPDHLADLRRSGLSDETILQAGITSVRPADIPKRLRFNPRGLVSAYSIPYPGLDYERLRCFWEPGPNGERRAKYLQASGSIVHLFVPTGVKSDLGDPFVPLYITEGEKKTLAGIQSRLCCIGLGGLWAWKRKGKLLSEFGEIQLERRHVYVIPDNDFLRAFKCAYGPDMDLAKAVHGLAMALDARGAEVKVMLLPDSGEKIGLDDFLLNHPVEALGSLETVDVAKFKELQKSAQKGPSHLEAARNVLDSFGDDNIVHTRFCTRKWNGAGVWEEIDDRVIKARIQNESGLLRVTAATVSSVLDLFKTECFKPGLEFDGNMSTVNVRNGELHWNGSEWELKPHSRDSYATTQLPVYYDEKANAPRFAQYLRECFQDDSDSALKVIIIHEMLGYCLLASCDYEKFFLLIGPGANGKSVLLDVAAELVGKRHVCAVQPSQFENRFQRAHLHGKLVNIVTEIAEGHEIADAQLKAIVSGELTTAEHKLRPPFDFKPFATCIFATNHMPHTRDFSDALFRRAIILSFNRIFREEEQDKGLKQKLVQELPGILNLALAGIAGVMLRGGVFTTCPGVEAMKSEWRLNCDQVAQFVDDRCKAGAGLKELSSKLYAAYDAWAKENGIRRLLNRNNFTTRLSRLGYEPAKGTAGVRLVYGLEVIG
jgi:P4 family phage/plasmid primase-like protien